MDEPSTASTATILHFTVKDTGVGMPVEKHEKIFEAFSQSDGSVTREYGGTGLGLTICVRLVGMMGGRVWMGEPARPREYISLCHPSGSSGHGFRPFHSPLARVRLTQSLAKITIRFGDSRRGGGFLRGYGSIEMLG